MNATKIAHIKNSNQDLNVLCDRVEKALYDNHIYYEAVYEDNGYLVIDVDGDWKHDHLRVRWFLQENFPFLSYEFTNSRDYSDDCYYGSQYYKVGRGCL
jgi:hypothetical protein